MLKVLTVVVASLMLCACAAGAGEAGQEPPAKVETVEPAPPAAQTEQPAEPPSGGRLGDLLARMDERSAEIKTLEADITITNRDNLTKRESSYTGKLYLSKPGDLYLDLADDNGYPRQIWLSPERIVDYKRDLKTAFRVNLAGDGERTTVLGLETSAAQLEKDFYITLTEPAGETIGKETLSLAPKEPGRFEFTSARVILDADSLLPVEIIQQNADLDETKTYRLSAIKKNPRLDRGLFAANLPRGTVVEEHDEGDWQAP